VQLRSAPIDGKHTE